MKKRGYGEWFGPGNGYEPERGLYKREDLDEKCHFELRPAMNAWLRDHSVARNPASALKRVAVNPDGERRASENRLAVWHPRLAALQVMQMLDAPTSEETYANAFNQVTKSMNESGNAMRNQAMVGEELARKRKAAG